MRTPRAAALAVALLALAVAVPAVLVSTERVAHAESDLAVGTQLVAISNVTLHRAAIARGSRVRVTKVSATRGRVTSVDVELADGHIVPSVAVARIRASFRVGDGS